MKKLVGGNWKMNCNLSTASVINGILPAHVDVFIAVPFIYIPVVKKLFPEGISICAQDVSYYESGAHTGEVSASMLADFKVEYVIIGHSERRTVFNETNNIISKKIYNALKCSITPILCIGEPIESRNDGNYLIFLKKQLDECLLGLEGTEIDIAYEPIWAIGGSESANEDQIKEVVAYIKKWMEHRMIRGRVIYGGSVNVNNAKSIAQINNLDGVLVGGASLGSEFIKIIEAFD